MGPVPARTCPGGWSPAGRPCVVGNAPAFVDELRWTLEVVAMRLLIIAGLLWCLALRLPRDVVLLDESPINRGLMIRAGNPRALLDFSGSKGLLVGGAIPANSGWHQKSVEPHVYLPML